MLTTPVIRCLKQQVDNAEVHYLTKSSFKEILADNPYIDKLHVLHNDFESLIDSLKKEHFDYIIDLHHNLRTLKVKKALGKIPAYSFNKLNVQKWLLTALKINLMPKVHIVDRYLDTIKTFNVKNDGKGLDYFIPADAVVPETVVDGTPAADDEPAPVAVSETVVDPVTGSGDEAASTPEDGEQSSASDT